MDFTITFFQLFWLILKIASPVILLSVAIIVALGQIAGRQEKWPAMEALYWSFITATTVGYGDIRPTRRWSRFLAVVIAFNGLILFGMVASIAVMATTEASQLHADLSLIRELEEIIDDDIDAESEETIPEEDGKN
ncbi:MAG: potassium channel family protein [Gammaproteobacteria bacterium]|nr:potassium channel family protein [Gammaproteobacteria bacterium]